ncbi:MAG: universal stress protein [Myxococcus sp.]|nr:universal stress protein [Myxococcus sp.]
MNALTLQNPQLDDAVAANDSALAANRRPVVLLRGHGAAHGAASRWATELARALATDVVVVRLISERPLRANVLFPQRHHADGLQNATAALRVMDARVRWQRRFHAGQTPPAMVSLEKSGTTNLAGALQGLDPRLVVVPSTGLWPGDSVSRLSLEANVPVLVARREPGHAPVIAASSLTDRRLPVLEQGASVAHALGRSLTFVHNVDPLVLAWTGDSLSPFVLPSAEQRVARHAADQLELAADAHDAGVTITRQGDPVGGILAAARRAHADLVVVGADPKPSLLSRRVTARVVASAPESVLVVPLRSPAPASSAEAPRANRSNP